MRMKKFGPRYGFKKFAEGGKPEESKKKPSPPPPPPPPPRKPVKTDPSYVSPKQEERLLRDQRYAEMDRKMNEAYERFRRSPESDSPGYKRGGKVKRKYAGGGGVPTSGGMYDAPAPQYPFPSSGGSGQTTNTSVTVGGQPTEQKPKTGPFDNLGDKQQPQPQQQMRRGGKVKRYAGGGSVSSASKRADGIAMRGKTKGRII